MLLKYGHTKSAMKMTVNKSVLQVKEVMPPKTIKEGLLKTTTLHLQTRTMKTKAKTIKTIRTRVRTIKTSRTKAKTIKTSRTKVKTIKARMMIRTREITLKTPTKRLGLPVVSELLKSKIPICCLKIKKIWLKNDLFDAYHIIYIVK